MSEDKRPQEVKDFLKFIAWDMKNLVAEIKKLNETLLTLKQKDLF